MKIRPVILCGGAGTRLVAKVKKKSSKTVYRFWRMEFIRKNFRKN